MKQLGWAILVLLVVHLLAVAGGVAWLASTDRLNRDRVEAVVATFRQTVAEEEAEAQSAAALEAEASRVAEETARLEILAAGARTLGDQLAQKEVRDELAMHRVERLKRETDDLRTQVERAQKIIADQRAELEAERAKFEAFLAETTARMQDEDFARAVQMYEQLKPKQAKQMFQQLLAEGQQSRVVEYLAAMQVRKAAAVFKEFRTPDEVTQATTLVEELRKRGVYVADETPTAIGGAT